MARLISPEFRTRHLALGSFTPAAVAICSDV
jgi:hypothetical protein